MLSTQNQLKLTSPNVSKLISRSFYVIFLEKLNLTITSEQAVNAYDMKCASGEYAYQYLFNGAPMYIRENAMYSKNGRVNTRRQNTYLLWYADGEWRLKHRRINGITNQWLYESLRFRKKTSCKYLSRNVLTEVMSFIHRFEYNQSDWKMGRVRKWSRRYR